MRNFTRALLASILAASCSSGREAEPGSNQVVAGNGTAEDLALASALEEDLGVNMEYLNSNQMRVLDTRYYFPDSHFLSPAFVMGQVKMLKDSHLPEMRTEDSFLEKEVLDGLSITDGALFESFFRIVNSALWHGSSKSDLFSRFEFPDAGRWMRRGSIKIFDLSTQSGVSQIKPFAVRVPTRSGKFDVSEAILSLEPGVWDINISLPSTKAYAKSSLALNAPFEIFVDGESTPFSFNSDEGFVDSRLMGGDAIPLSYNVEQVSNDTACDGVSEKIWHHFGQSIVNSSTPSALVLPQYSIADNGHSKGGLNGTIAIDSARLQGGIWYDVDDRVTRKFGRHRELNFVLDNTEIRPIDFRGNEAAWKLRTVSSTDRHPYIQDPDTIIHTKLRNSNQTVASFDFNSNYGSLIGTPLVRGSRDSATLVWNHFLSFDSGKGVAADKMVSDVPITVSWPGTNRPPHQFLIDQTNAQKSEKCFPGDNKVYKKLVTVYIPKFSRDELSMSSFRTVKIKFSVDNDVQYRRKGRSSGFVVTPVSVNAKMRPKSDFSVDTNDAIIRNFGFTRGRFWRTGADRLFVSLEALVPEIGSISDMSLVITNGKSEKIVEVPSIRSSSYRSGFDYRCTFDICDFEDGRWHTKSYSFVGISRYGMSWFYSEYPSIYRYSKIQIGLEDIPLSPIPVVPGWYTAKFEIHETNGHVREFETGKYFTVGYNFGGTVSTAEPVLVAEIPASITAQLGNAGESCSEVCGTRGFTVASEWQDLLNRDNGLLCKALFSIPSDAPNGDFFSRDESGTRTNLYEVVSTGHNCSRRQTAVFGTNASGLRYTISSEVVTRLGASSNSDPDFKEVGFAPWCGCKFRSE